MADQPILGLNHKRLEAFVGTWATTGTIKSGAHSGVTVQAMDTYEWLPGGFFLVHRWDAHMPDGRTQGIEIIGYDAASNTYPMHSFDSAGNISVMRASVKGENWTFEGPSLRFTGGFSDDGDTFAGLWEQRASEAAEWLPWMDIKLTQVIQPA